MHRDTVFVRGLQPGTNHEELNEFFSEIGPVREAYIVVEKDGPNKGKSRGFGFVRFALAEDALEAVQKLQNQKLADGILSLELAEKKGYKHTNKNLSDSKVSTVSSTKKNLKQQNNVYDLFEDLAKSSFLVNKCENSKENVQTSNEELDRTKELLYESGVVFYNLPVGIKESFIRKKAGKIGKINFVKIPFSSGDNHEIEKQSCIVIYTKPSSASLAVVKFDNKEWFINDSTNSKVFCRRIKHIACNPKTKSRCLLIVRNLPYSIEDSFLNNLFSAFGPILELRVVKKNNEDISRGFAFVKFACRLDAQRAMTSLNGTNVKNRQIVIDWAFNKNEYEYLLNKKMKNSETLLSSQDERSEHKTLTTKNDNLEDEKSSVTTTCSSSSINCLENVNSEQKKIFFREKIEEKNLSAQNGIDKDEELNLTLFVRNILFETNEEALFECFKRFGSIRYVKLARDSENRSRGTGFVNYYHMNSVNKALIAAEESPLISKNSKEANNNTQRGGNGIVLDGRPLLVSLALKPELVKQLEQDNSKKAQYKDKRHLYLLREGYIHSESSVCIPKSDLIKRERVHLEKKNKLNNPLFFVSPFRLSIRNLYRGQDETSTAITDHKIKKIFMDAAIQGIRNGLVDDLKGDDALYPIGWPNRSNLKSPCIKSIHLMRDTDSILILGDSKKKNKRHGRLKGYGFVEFTEHIHALAALRVINNNPSYAFLAVGGSKSMNIPSKDRSRLIVEFAIENAGKLRIQKLRKEKQKLKITKTQSSSNEPNHNFKKILQYSYNKNAAENIRTKISKKKKISIDNRSILTQSSSFIDKIKKRKGGKPPSNHESNISSNKKKKQDTHETKEAELSKDKHYQNLVKKFKEEIIQDKMNESINTVKKKHWFDV